MRGEIAVLQQAFLETAAITGGQHLEQVAERGFLRHLNRHLAVSYDPLDEAHKYYFHLNHGECQYLYHSRAFYYREFKQNAFMP